ncbi:MAG TPA: hypothetical protein VNF29_14735, partial [Candidatus Binataceae bacterium]|nr:hypothetical protein [Candidatus Binataceae bacterium]
RPARFSTENDLGLDLTWMNVVSQWGTRARPTDKGLTLGAINIGVYGEIPEVYENDSEMARGSIPRPGAIGFGNPVREKAEVWTDTVPELYEESIRRRWRPSLDIPWESIAPLAPDLELATAQFATVLSENALVCLDVIARWLREISYGFHEVKLLMAAQEFEAGRHFEAFRKRAVINGGRLGFESSGKFLRLLSDAKSFNETSILLHVMYASFTRSWFSAAVKFSRSEGDRKLYTACAADLDRWLAYGTGRLRGMLEKKPERREQVHSYLLRGEIALTEDWRRDTPFREALAILLGGGLPGVRDGLKRLGELRALRVDDYLAQLELAGVPERRTRVFPALRM